MTAQEQKMVEEMVQNNILEAINSLLIDLAHGVPTNLISPTRDKKLNNKIQKLVSTYRPKLFETIQDLIKMRKQQVSAKTHLILTVLSKT